MNRDMRTALLAMGAVGVVLVVFFVGTWVLYRATNNNPCNSFSGGKTGLLVYEGHTFKCWHGDIVGER